MSLPGNHTSSWLKARKATYEQWVTAARSQKNSSQLELFAWKPTISITLGAEEYIWKDGQLYRAVRHLEQSPWTYPQPVEPAIQQPNRNGDVFIGDVPSWYTITWCSDHTDIDKKTNQENGYIIWQ